MHGAAATELAVHAPRAFAMTALKPAIVQPDTSVASALPTWLIVALLGLVAAVVLAMFALTAYSLSAPRSTLKNVLGQGRMFRRPLKAEVSKDLVTKLATAAREGKRTTRTTLAIAGFSLLGVIVVAIFGSSGQGVRDLRSQVVASVTTLAATIAGFYFGAQTASRPAAPSGNAQAAADAKVSPAGGPEAHQGQAGGLEAGQGQPGGPEAGQGQVAQEHVQVAQEPDPLNAGHAGGFQAS